MYSRIRKIMRGGNINRTAPLFPPKYWTVFEQKELRIPRTQDCIEALHRRFKILVRKCHVGVYTIIKEFQKEKIQVE